MAAHFDQLKQMRMVPQSASQQRVAVLWVMASTQRQRSSLPPGQGEMTLHLRPSSDELCAKHLESHGIEQKLSITSTKSKSRFGLSKMASK